jgi:DNA-binding transcriptional MerR regulator
MLTFEEPVSRSELARALDIGRVTLMRWEQAGLIPPAERVSGNRSMFSPIAQRRVAALVEARSC